ncbi:MAG: TonB-dependent receptor [Acidobacteria bacterium]|nr:TonB-dependent receptor [Acidobacteriota bacterium]MBS1864930.1 TonB-dependent receptor [Acidobacteriota bacterium]
MDLKTVRFWGGRRLLLVGAACLVLLWMTAMSASAQVDTGTILGTVSDSSGARINGATVTLTNEGTNAALSTTTGEDGGYKFTPVRIGSYKLSVTMQGFQTAALRGVNVNVGQSVVADFSMKPGAVSETIEVTSSAPVLQSQDASVGQIVDSKSVNDLPLNGRNFTFLAQLAAGVNTPQADTRGNAASGAFSANGSRPAQNNYLLDGIDNNSDTVDFLNGTNFVVLPPVDAIAEFKVQTSGFSAEYGRSGAAVLNATIKSGTNELHGAAWEYFRNDKLDAADFFENAGGIPKGALRQNQFGVAAGGPIIKNKIFFFGDYEGFRRVQGTVATGTVPTQNMINTGFTDLSELLTQGGTETDGLCSIVPTAGNKCPAANQRTFPTGTVFDPRTTRAVTAGSVDPITGLHVVNSGFVRDPFGTCNPLTTLAYTAACGLNQLPAGLIDANALKLLGLYPKPTNSSVFSNYAVSPKLFEHRNAFDARMDINANEKNQLFFRFSLVDDPQFIPGIFTGIADGGGFQQGDQTANAQQSAFSYTHTFSPTLINVVRAGLNYLHTTRVSPKANDLSDIPSQFGILRIPQQAENGGLPAIGISGYQTLGSNAFLPSDEVSSTFQLTDDLTKIYGKHTFKMGFEWQHVKFSTLQPPWSRGQMNFDGTYTDVPGKTSGNVGLAQLLLIPQVTSVPGGIDYVGGPNNVFVSNISLTDNGKNYYGVYVNDDWKVTNKLTLNLGVRWDYFQPVYEHHGNQANFIPDGAPTGGPAYLIPKGGANAGNLSPSFIALLAQDGIALVNSTYEKTSSLAQGQKTNFAPRFGFAYQWNPKLVVRGGFGIFYNGFENRGFSPNLGENYPFQFNFQYTNLDAGHPYNKFQNGVNGCVATPTGGPTFETGFSCSPLDPAIVNASGLSLRGIQFDYLTPYSMGGNLTVQYQLTPTMSVQAGYVTTLARHLEVFPGNNNVTSLEPSSVPVSTLLPFPDFGQGSSQAQTEGSSNYHSLQTRVEKQFRGGLTFLATYTWAKTMSDAGDLLNGGSDNVGYRAPSVPGFGIQKDFKLANFDIRNVFHLSGGYELPFGKGKKFMADASGITDKLVGGWSVQWIATLQGGQPITLSCVNNSLQGTGCGALFSGKTVKTGLHTNNNGQLSWFGYDPALDPDQVNFSNSPFIDAPACGGAGTCTFANLGGVTQVPGPGFHRLDFSIFKDFPFNEKRKLQFRTEIFNVTNHPNFNAPGFGGNGVVSIGGSLNWTNSHFGEIGSTRDNPYDPRQIQFALKFLF